MLEITVPESELWDESKNEFILIPEQTLQLEHSLAAISKWEMKWKKAFLTKKEKTVEETLDYIRCMTITDNVDLQIYNCLTRENFQAIDSYLEDPMTATVIYQTGRSQNTRDTSTSELIYYYMISFGIPLECEKWPFQRLIALLEVFSLKNSPPKKINQNEIMRRNASINEARKKKWNTRG